MERNLNTGIFLLLGSNEGNPADNLFRAKMHLEEHVGKIIAYSSLYKTAAWGKTDQAEFFNQVVEIRTSRSPEKLLAKILWIEKEMGRLRLEKWGKRIIDIDILFYRDVVVDTSELKIPHPAIKERKFTLVPLAEIASDFIHPQFNKSIQLLLDECKDPLSVELLTENNL